MIPDIRSPIWQGNTNFQCPECKNGGYIVHHYMDDLYGCRACEKRWDKKELLTSSSDSEASPDNAHMEALSDFGIYDEEFDSQQKDTPIHSKVVPGY